MYLRNRFGIPGVIAVIALVFAMFGGAYAATKGGGRNNLKSQPGLNSKQKREVKALAKGSPGPAGPQGPAGSNGKDGSSGATGAQGPAGNAGEDGEDGEDGSPWTAGGVLPPGSTETGSYFAIVPEEFTLISAAISFSIPLSGPLDAAHSIYVPVGNTSTTHCSAAPLNGTAANPKADEGYLCVYGVVEANVSPVVTDPSISASPPGAARSGAGVSGFVTTTVPGNIKGTWAVTG